MHGTIKPIHLLPAAFLLLGALVLPSVAPAYFIYVVNGMMMYGILALGLDILLGWSGLFAFAHIAFYGIGIYVTALLNARFGIGFLAAIPIAALVSGAVGCVIALCSMRLRTVYLALATYAFAECAQWIFRNWESVTGGSNGLRIPPQSAFGIVIDSDARAFPVLAAILAIVLTATLCLAKSRLGRHLHCIHESEHVAAASGINVERTRLLAFVVSAMYAGVAGGAFSLFQTFVTPDALGAPQLVLVLTMIVVGGSGSIPGVMLGVVFIGLLTELLRSAPASWLVWQEFVFGLILLLALMFMPRGLWGVIEGLRSRRADRPEAAPEASVIAPQSGGTQ